jgi:multicomponent Na+:H+ antiporter subunit D
MGIALRTAAGSAGTFLYMIHSSLSLVAAFLLAGEIYRVGGSYDLRHLGGLAKHAPRLHVGWLIVTLSLAGVPPLSGFFGKYALIRAAIESGQVGMVVALLLSSVFVLAAVLRVWAMAFGRTEPAPLAPAKLGKTAYVLSAAVAGFAVAAPFVTRACARSGAELAEPEAYASRILEGR